jgi:cytokinin dehydrogenase
MLTSKAFPTFEGRLLLSGDLVTEAAEDFGHLSHQKPIALLQPASSEDVSKLIRFASENQLPVTARGQGHSMGGQALTAGGVVIDTRSLSKIRSLDPDGVWAEVGLTWSALNKQTLLKGLVVPALTDHSRLSIGGVLSVGGISGQAFRFGAQVDTVEALEVVTSQGEIIRCSQQQEQELFVSCLGGLGQFAIITAAKLMLVDAPERVRTYEALYPSPEIFLALQMQLCHEGYFDYVAGLAVPSPAGGWGFLVQASKFYRREHPPNNHICAEMLYPKPVELTLHDRSLTEFLDRGDEQERELKEAGLWGVPHPWLVQFCPRSNSLECLTALASAFKPADIGNGVIALYPLLSKPTQASFLCLPNSKECFLIGVLSNVLSPTQERTAKLVEQKRVLFAKGQALGTKLYPVGLLPQRGEWAEHYGERWMLFQERKKRFDPLGILGTNLKIE